MWKTRELQLASPSEDPEGTPKCRVEPIDVLLVFRRVAASASTISGPSRYSATPKARTSDAGALTLKRRWKARRMTTVQRTRRREEVTPNAVAPLRTLATGVKRMTHSRVPLAVRTPLPLYCAGDSTARAS